MRLRGAGFFSFIIFGCSFFPASASEKTVKCFLQEVAAERHESGSLEPITDTVTGHAFRIPKASGGTLRVVPVVQLTWIAPIAPLGRPFQKVRIPLHAISTAVRANLFDSSRPVTVGGGFRLPTDLTGPSRGANTVGNLLTDLVSRALPEQLPGWFGRIQVDIAYWVRGVDRDGGLYRDPLRIGIQGTWTRGDLQVRLPRLSLPQPADHQLARVSAAEALDSLRTGSLRILLERIPSDANVRVLSIEPGQPLSLSPEVVTLHIEGEQLPRTSILPPRRENRISTPGELENDVVGALFGEGLVLPAMRGLVPGVPRREASRWALPTFGGQPPIVMGGALGGQTTKMNAFRTELIEFTGALFSAMQTPARTLANTIPTTALEKGRAVGWVREAESRSRQYRERLAVLRNDPEISSQLDLNYALRVVDMRLTVYESALRALVSPALENGPDFGRLGRALFSHASRFRGEFWEYIAFFHVPNPIAMQLHPRNQFDDFQRAFARVRALVGQGIELQAAPPNPRIFYDRVRNVLRRPRFEDPSSFTDADKVIDGELDVLFVDVDHRPVIVEVKTNSGPTADPDLVPAVVMQLRRDRNLIEASGLDSGQFKFAAYLPASETGTWAREFRTAMRRHGFAPDQIAVFIGPPR